MLVLSRKVGQRILIGDDITITVVRVAGDKVRIGIVAPSDILILREELKRTTPPASPPPLQTETAVSQ